LFNAKVQNYFVGCIFFRLVFPVFGKSLAINYLRGDDLRRCKRCSFAVQKVAFWRVKDGLSQCKRWPFVEHPIFCVISLSRKRIYVCDLMKSLISILDYFFLSSEALGNCHSARRRGNQCIQQASFAVFGILWIPRRRAE
jgi:hypothetical protein